MGSGYHRKKLKHGLWMEHHANGTKKAEGPLFEGERWGVWTLWSDDGSLHLHGAYADGQRDGAWRDWTQVENAVVVSQ